jgi:hypothetical protein
MDKSKRKKKPVAPNRLPSMDNIVTVKAVRKEPKSRKRSAYMHQFQSKLDFLENEMPVEFPVDIEIVNDLKAEDLYEDYSQSDEKGKPFNDFTHEEQKQFISKMKDLSWYRSGLTLEDVMKSRKIDPKKHTNPDELPVLYSTGHKHDRIQIPDIFNMYGNQKEPDVDRDYTRKEIEHNPVITAKVFKDPFSLLGSRFKTSLLNTYNCKIFESYINAKIFNMADEHGSKNVQISDMLSDIHKETSLSCMAIKYLSNRIDIEKKTTPLNRRNEKEREENRIAMVFRMEDNDIFYLCIVTRLLGSAPKILSEKVYIPWTDAFVSSKEGKFFLDINLNLIFETYFYFNCGCEL